MLIGYVRVSTADQSLDLQRDALLAIGVAPERIYEDVCSGKATDRPGLDRALDVARTGDVVAVWKLDRVGRSLPHVAALAQLAREGHDIRPEDVARLSPLVHTHVNMLGRYAFTLPDNVAAGELRPLRDPRTATLDDP